MPRAFRTGAAVAPTGNMKPFCTRICQGVSSDASGHSVEARDSEYRTHVTIITRETDTTSGTLQTTVSTLAFTACCSANGQNHLMLAQSPGTSVSQHTAHRPHSALHSFAAGTLARHDTRRTARTIPWPSVRIFLAACSGASPAVGGRGTLPSPAPVMPLACFST